MAFASKRAMGAETPPGALHHLRATPKTVHWGYFDAALAPALRVKSGDLIHAESITHHAGDAPDLMMDETVSAIFREVPEYASRTFSAMGAAAAPSAPTSPPTGAISTRSSARRSG